MIGWDLPELIKSESLGWAALLLLFFNWLDDSKGLTKCLDGCLLQQKLFASDSLQTRMNQYSAYTKQGKEFPAMAVDCGQMS